MSSRQVVYDRLEILCIFRGWNEPDGNQILLILLRFDKFVQAIADFQ